MTVTAPGVRVVSGIVVLVIVLGVVLVVVLGVVLGVVLAVLLGVVPGVVLTAVLRRGPVCAPVVRGVRTVPLERAPCPAPWWCWCACPRAVRSTRSSAVGTA
ncbi:hypothetical protein PV341_25165 [Streptomyces sp. PA03-1a]|nr:hypothetical protein [Streptomyces sp. PA03-1a]